MVIPVFIKEYQRRYKELQNEYICWDALYEEIVTEGCGSCEHYRYGRVERYGDRLAGCSDCKDYAERKRVCDELEAADAKLEYFMDEEYSRAVFEIGSRWKWKLVDVRTEQVLSWEEAYGTAYEKVSKNLRRSLIGLAEGYGQYKFKSKFVWL